MVTLIMSNQALGATFWGSRQSVDFRSGAFNSLKEKHLSAKGRIMIHELLARKNKRRNKRVRFSDDWWS